MPRSWSAPSVMPCSTSSSKEPGRLREVTGIGPKRAERIVGGWAEQKVIREIMLFLHSNGVGKALAIAVKGAQTRRRWSKLREARVGRARNTARISGTS